MNIIIPAAGISSRMKILGSKALLRVGNETIIQRQIRILREVYPESKITVVVGYDKERVMKTFPANIDTITNHHFEKTNVVYSLSVAMEYLNSKRKTLFVYGDMVFDNETIALFQGTNHSTILYDERERINSSEVGLTIQDDKIISFNYSFKTKFVPIFLLGAKELKDFRSLCKLPNNANKYSHEILNGLIDRHQFKNISIPEQNLLLEVDTRKDLKAFNALAIDV